MGATPELVRACRLMTGEQRNRMELVTFCRVIIGMVTGGDAAWNRINGSCWE